MPPQPLSVGELINIGIQGEPYQPGVLVMIDNETIAVVVLDHFQLTVGATPEVILYITLDGSRRTLQLQRRIECGQRVQYGSFRWLPDDRIGLLGNCLEAGAQQGTTYVLVHDESAGATSLLVSNPLPIADSRDFAWNPGLNQLVVSFGTITSGLYWFDSSGPQPVTGTVTAYGRRFTLDAAWLNYGTPLRTETGNATSPDWSPDGNTLAFLASTDAIGRDSIDRLTGRWLIAVMDLQTLQPEIVVGDIYGKHKVRWSENGDYLAFSGQLGSAGKQGLWVYSLTTRESTLIATGEFRDFIWSPDGGELYAIRYADGQVDRTEVWKYDVRGLIGDTAR